MGNHGRRAQRLPHHDMQKGYLAADSILPVMGAAPAM